ncbi:hypothetical protein PpBr36_09067 [Pyricularia pennisetigena]|nr:hypothetical protein PpBr36_09067 [Pyricularia pennisetigena]TLS24315.1 hypothetical protein PpBr36_09067 [Pyricularia pennisetigena]
MNMLGASPTRSGPGSTPGVIISPHRRRWPGPLMASKAPL